MNEKCPNPSVLVFMVVPAGCVALTSTSFKRTVASDTVPVTMAALGINTRFGSIKTVLSVGATTLRTGGET